MCLAESLYTLDRGVGSPGATNTLYMQGGNAAQRQHCGEEDVAMVQVHGEVAPGFARVRDAFAAHWETDGEIGASVSVTVAGDTVVDLWAGTATYDHGDGEWERDTIVNTWSTTKTMAVLCCLLLADRGELDLDAPVATYWPEFEVAGKQDITTAHILSHTSGVAGWETPVGIADIVDHDRMASLLATQQPWWEPGTRSGYHAMSYGCLLAEIIKRIDGRSLGQYFAQEIAAPLDADFHIGTPAALDARVSHLVANFGALGADDPRLEGHDIARRTLTNPVLRASSANEHAWRRAEIPAGNGHGNARSVARVHTMTALGGEVGGLRLLSEGMVDKLFTERVAGRDAVLLGNYRFGLGFALPNESVPLPSPRSGYWGGWGGSLVVVDRDTQLSFAYVMNKMSADLVGDMRGSNLLLATYGAVLGA